MNWIDAETTERIIQALMPYEHEIKSKKHRAMARQNRQRDVVTVMQVLADCGYQVKR